MSSPDAHLHTTTISARVSHARHAEITALAQAEGISLAKWLVQAIAAKLEKKTTRGRGDYKPTGRTLAGT